MQENLDIIGIQRNWPQYKILGELGHGAYGKVYKIKRENLNSTSFSAVKVIHIPTNSDMEYQLLSEGMTKATLPTYYAKLADGFLRENALMEQLKGASNIVNIEDCISEKNADGYGYTIYIKMELLESFENLMHNYELGPEDIVTVGQDLCEALIVCEQKNIVHRDIKPANVFINEFGDFKLGDFGVAKQLDNNSGMTQVGTGMYMAPELYQGTASDARVDIYSLGIMLYQLGNEGCFPFLTPSTLTPANRQDALLRRLSGEPLPLPSHVDEELGRIILKACAHNPKDRYASAKELKNDLDCWAYEHRFSQRFPDSTPTQHTANSSVYQQSSDQKPGITSFDSITKSSKGIQILVAAIFIAIGLIGTIICSISRPSEYSSTDKTQIACVMEENITT